MRFFTSLRFVQNDKWGSLSHLYKLLFTISICDENVKLPKI